MSGAVSVPQVSARLSASAALGESVARLPYVSAARAEALERAGVSSAAELLRRIPRRYLDFTHASKIEQAPIGSVCTVVGTVDRVSNRPTRTRGLVITEVCLVDETGVLKLAFFKQPWLADQLSLGDRLAVMGTVEFSYGFRQMTSPHFEKLDEGSAQGSIMPMHSACDQITPAWMRRIISSALTSIGSTCDPLPAGLRARRRLMSASRALRCIHFPFALSEVEAARRRFAYDELLYLQFALRLRNDCNLLAIPAFSQLPADRVRALRSELPFALTEEQDDAVGEILADMSDGGRIMNRLLLGDVGTGKTAVACFALACAADAGNQACVMAPTGVLARQYADKSGPLLERAGVRCALLTASTGREERADILDGLASGSIDVLFGTHAVLEDDVRFARLSLAVIDEQHRFGVGQRNALRSKGEGADLLVMTATPIPRTLAMSVYGDLDTSVIRHRPNPGAGVTTRVLESPNRDIAYGALRDAVTAGRQAYVVCPLVAPKDDPHQAEDALAPLPPADEDRAAGTVLHSVASELETIRRVVPGVSVEALHGRMPPKEKDRVIDAFRAGDIQVLVSTTVVEVGVDVPRATLMIIENGERFGLATLHQLRGRVGRGSVAGECYIIIEQISKRGRKSPARDRLAALERTSDGFELAELDLRLRHEGEILGFRQSGGVSLHFVDLDRDTDLIEWAQADARAVLDSARSLSTPETLPMRHEMIERYGNIFKEVSGG